MAAVTSCTQTQILPTSGLRVIKFTTPATADSNDTIDINTASNGGYLVIQGILGAYDATTGDDITATFSGTTITIDAAGGTTNHVYHVYAFVKC